VAKTRRHEGRVAGVQVPWSLVGVLRGSLAGFRISGSRSGGADRQSDRRDARGGGGVLQLRGNVLEELHRARPQATFSATGERGSGQQKDDTIEARLWFHPALNLKAGGGQHELGQASRCDAPAEPHQQRTRQRAGGDDVAGEANEEKASGTIGAVTLRPGR